MRSLYFFLSISCLNNVYAVSLPNHTLKAYDCDHCETLSHTPLSTSWPIQAKLFKHSFTKQESTKYQIDVTARQLKQGVSISTSAPQAVIRIIPMNKKMRVNTSQFHLRKPNHFDVTLLEASTDFQINTNYSSLTNADWVFQLKPNLGSGKFSLSLVDFDSLPSARFQIRIFDKHSLTALHVETNKSYYQYGDKLITTLFLKQGSKRYVADTVEANLLSPDGQLIPIPLSQVEPAVYRGKIKLDNETNFPGQNWYIETNVMAKVDEKTIKRHAHTAFSYAIPSAQITEITKTKSLNFNATIQAATGSRYAVQAILFKVDNQGKRHAIEIAQSANWLSPGKTSLPFSFKYKIANSDHSPYYLGSIQLIDYGQLKPVFEHHTLIDIASLG